MNIRSIVVFCGSKTGINPLFEEETVKLGTILAEKNMRIIYGGGNKGLMAAIANSVLKNGGHVTGIIPEVLTNFEQQHTGLSELIVVDNMHERKKLLYERADAAIVLPGGFGTLDELFEMLTWNQLKIHEKKIFILNTGGFYEHLIQHIHRMHDEGFLYARPDEQITALHKVEDIHQYL